MTQFYSAIIESVLCSSITVWFGSASKSDIRRLQRIVKAAERIIGVHLPSLQDLYNSKVKKWAGNIITDPSHPGHNLFGLLASGRHYRSLCTRTRRHSNRFSPCHLQPKQLTLELLPVFCNSFSIFNYCLSLKYYVNTYAHYSIQLYIAVYRVIMHKSVHKSVPDSYTLLLLFIVKSYLNVFFSCQICMYACMCVPRAS